MKRNNIATIILTAVFSVTVSFLSFAQWQQDKEGWRYETEGSYVSSGWKAIDGSWYYFKRNGYMHTGWVESKGLLYYLGPDGAMVTGEQVIDGKAYTFAPDGHKQMDGIHRDGLEDGLLTEAVEKTWANWGNVLYAVELINEERAQGGLHDVRADYALSVIANYRNAHMNQYNYFDHYIDKRYLAEEAASAYIGRRIPVRENIWIYGYFDNPTKGVVNPEPIPKIVEMAHGFYVDSPSHYENIMAADATKVGIGVLKSANGTRDYISMIFDMNY